MDYPWWWWLGKLCLAQNQYWSGSPDTPSALAPSQCRLGLVPWTGAGWHRPRTTAASRRPQLESPKTLRLGRNKTAGLWQDDTRLRWRTNQPERSAGQA